jgi:hypothetical protein
MSITIYFGKVNLVSSQIGDALFNSISLRNILSELLNALRDNTSYTYTTTKQININETVTEDIEYSLSIKEKTDTDLQGYLHKKSYLYYKDFDKQTKEIISKKIENTESSEFYYDVFREMIGYQRTLRFGYKEFLYGFEGILNTACTNANLDYKFTVNQYTEGLDINDLRNELISNNQQIQTLKIKYQIPNPNFDTLRKIHLNPEETIKNFRSANLATKYVTYQSFTNSALNISSEIIEQELQNIDNMHSSINAKEALKNGYVEVETTNIYGVKKSSTDTKPIVKHINNILELKDAASIVILNNIRNSIEI